MLRYLLCRLGYHHRSGKHVFRGSNGIMKSRCHGCDAPMVHDHDNGTWRLAAPQGKHPTLA